MHTNVMHDNAIAFMIHQCREAAAVSLLVIQFSNRATSLIGRLASAARRFRRVWQRQYRRGYGKERSVGRREGSIFWTALLWNVAFGSKPEKLHSEHMFSALPLKGTSRN